MRKERKPLTVSHVKASRVTRRVVFTLLGGPHDGLPVSVTLSWSAEDPFAVGLVFTHRSGPVRWVVSRELLAAGLKGPAGLGEVSVRPALGAGCRIEVVLSSPRARARFTVARTALAAFLTETTKHEVVDLDSVLDHWLRVVTG